MTLKVKINALEYDVEPGIWETYWAKVNRGRWEPETFAIFDRHIGPETLVLDIGSWIGPTVLYAAQTARKCVAFEPDPVAFKALTTNVAANADAPWADRLSIVNAAVTGDGEAFALGTAFEPGDSRSSVLFGDRETSWTVAAVRLEDVLAEHAAPDQPVFLKIDIEGGEFDLLPQIAPILAQPHVSSFISFHGKFLRKSLVHDHPDGFDWRPPFIATCQSVYDALPWSRAFTFDDDQPNDRASREAALHDKASFPYNVVIA